MRRTAFSLLLALAGAAHAALPRAVVLEAPLAPRSAPAALGAAGAALTAAPSLPTALAPAAPAAFAPAPAAALAPAAPAPAALVPAALMPAPAAGPRLTAAGPRRAAEAREQGPRGLFLSALRENAPLIERAAEDARRGSLEDAAPALERSFAAAAGLGPVVPSEGAAIPKEDREPVTEADHGELLRRLLQRVTLDDHGDPRERAALRKTFERMLQSATARELAEKFAAEGAAAVVRFERFEDSRIFNENGRKTFHAARAYTEWKDDHALVRLNMDYLETDELFQSQDLPPTLAHELFGHGLWYARAAREDAFQAFHHHELNEMNARTIGWNVDFELDRFFDDSGAWSYLQDPAGYLPHLKTRLTYYALTFSNEELARPIETLEGRLAAARARRARLETELTNHKTWNPVIDYLVSRRVIPEARTRALRGYMTESEAAFRYELTLVDALIAEVAATLDRMRAEPDRMSERYLQEAAARPVFTGLLREHEELSRRLLESVSASGARHDDEPEEVRRAREEHWRGQVTFEELVEIYTKDRAKNPKLWAGGA